MPNFSRREFIRLSALTGASLYLGFRPWELLAAPNSVDDSPIGRVGGIFPSLDFNGDDVRRPHQLLWDVEGYVRSKGGRPLQATAASVVVVGGGMAGLLSAYFLRDQKPLLLEQAQRFGGNSQGEVFGGATYSTGAAYITVPETGGAIDRMFRELGLDKQLRLEPESEARVLYQGIQNLWAGETDLAALASARKVSAALKAVYQKSYPNIPWSPNDPLSQAQLSALDQKTAIQWLRSVDPQLHPHIEEYFQVYAWSSFGGSLDELSAAQFLNFAAAETQGVMAFAGGNAAIAAALHANLLRVLPAGSLASNSIVLEVKEVPGGVEVLYENTKGALRLVKARSVVFAAPKYVAKGIVKNLAPAQASAWKSMNYRAYVVANVLLKRKVDPKAFDLFRLQGKVPETPSFGRKPARAFTDLVFADWASRGKATQSVLTVYKPLPYDGARNSLVDAHARILRELETEMAQTLPLLGIPASELAGIRLTRWAHSVPLAEPGLIKNGSLEKIGAPHGRISFANQDNYMNPAFETAFSAAEKAAGEARKFL